MVRKNLNHWRSLNSPASDAQEMLWSLKSLRVFFTALGHRRRQNGDTSLFFFKLIKIE